MRPSGSQSHRAYVAPLVVSFIHLDGGIEFCQALPPVTLCGDHFPYGLGFSVGRESCVKFSRRQARLFPKEGIGQKPWRCSVCM